MIDFPSSPSVGQTYNSGSGAIYVWDGVAWSISTSQTATALSRNLIVNPCGHISQENGQTAQTVASAYIADQWALGFVASTAAVSVKSDGAVINPSGSTTRLLYKTTTAKASLAAGDFALFETKLEAFRALPLGYAGNAPVQSVLRFGFAGPAGTYSVAIRNLGSNTVCWIGQFTISAGQANIDTTQVLVIQPPPSGYAWGAGTAGQVDLIITLAAGSTFIAPANGWQAGNLFAGPGQFNLLGTVNNQAQIWDVGLYADPSRTGLPPAFQVPDYALDLMECMRYWEPIVSGVFAYGGTVGATVMSPAPFKAAKRAVPSTAIISNGTTSNATAYAMYGVSTLGALYGANAVATGIVGAYPSSINANARM